MYSDKQIAFIFNAVAKYVSRKCCRKFCNTLTEEEKMKNVHVLCKKWKKLLSREELCHVLWNIFSRCKICLGAGDQRFETLL